MSSFSIEEFIGNGVLKELLPKLLEEGWDDVPTIKAMSLEDMDAINMTQQQKDALEIRSFLHDRALLQYGDDIEASGKTLAEILKFSAMELSTLFLMKRGHIARFKGRSRLSADFASKDNTIMAAKTFSVSSRTNSSYGGYMAIGATSMQSTRRLLETPLSDLRVKDGYILKGVVASEPAYPRACGCMQPPAIDDEMAPYSAIENISVQKLTPEYKIGMEKFIKMKAHTVKASDLWRSKPAVLLCIRRPGCIMCRAEAHQLYTKKNIFDALGVQLYAILLEHIESEVRNFWPRYWGGAVLLDRNMEFFKALGGGKLLRDKFLSGFLLNPRAIANYKRAKAMGLEQNFKGQGEIKGGLFIVGSGKSGIAYQFIEKNFGDWVPIEQVIEICSTLQKERQSQRESIESSRD